MATEITDSSNTITANGQYYIKADYKETYTIQAHGQNIGAVLLVNYEGESDVYYEDKDENQNAIIASELNGKISLVATVVCKNSEKIGIKLSNGDGVNPITINWGIYKRVVQ